MTLHDLIARLEPVVKENIRPQGDGCPVFTIFLSCSVDKKQATVVHASADNFATAWESVTARCLSVVGKESATSIWLRADWVTGVQSLKMGQFREALKAFKRNYFRYGLAFDARFEFAFLETELNANAMLYRGTAYSHALLNKSNFNNYARKRFAETFPALDDDQAPMFMLTTHGAFCTESLSPQLLYGVGRNAGRRKLDQLKHEQLLELIDSASHYLAGQVQQNGRFHYGWHPCFDRPIKAYNALRHASTIYSMLEAWEITGSHELMASIERAIKHLLDRLVKKVALENGAQAAFVVDLNDEIKLGANAVSILALTKYAELTGSTDHREWLQALAEGILFMQDAEMGSFVHVLNYPDLSVKDRFRVIYYEGEAAFALMRLYRLTEDPRWIGAVEKAFEYFIAENHWQYHDHWLSYCVNELTCYRPEQCYYRFGLMNVAGHLDFVEKRITTYPTLLELMMAARAMIERLKSQPENSALLTDIDLAHFNRALETRAHYLLNGYFWPELAMFYRNPAKIVGSFFIRHHAFRVRIDDVEHYLSGYVAYLKYRREIDGTKLTRENPPPALTGHRTSVECRYGFAKLSNFPVDIERLQEHFYRHVKPVRAVPYSQYSGSYSGWAVTSSDGTLDDGVTLASLASGAGDREGSVRTAICHGYLAGLLTALKLYGLSLQKVRIMQLEAGEELPYHIDDDHSGWRLHIPIVTSQGSRFEWLNDRGDIESVHLPADGSAWLVRVDSPHRVIVRDNPGFSRVHLIMELGGVPAARMFSR